MGIEIEAQTMTVLWALTLGGSLGVFYDVARILRHKAKNHLLGGLLDICFWIIATTGLFLLAIMRGGGEVRVYMVCVVVIGATLYFLTISRLVVIFLGIFAEIVRFLLGICLLPIHTVKAILKKIVKKQKNDFHYRRKWYRIGIIPDSMEVFYQNVALEAGGTHRVQNQENSTTDQVSSTGVAGLHGNGLPEHPGSDTRSKRSGKRLGTTGRSTKSKKCKLGRRSGKSR